MTSGSRGDAGPDYDWSWTEDANDWIPPDVDTTRPSPARMYDYALGGKDNFAVDRAAVEEIGQRCPDYQRAARLNRSFLLQTVQMIAEIGVRQFIDLGTGIPTSPNVHEVARKVNPDTRVVYVDNDPIVMAHNRALRATVPDVITVQHDLRQPSSVLEDPNVRALIDFDEPVGLLMVAVLHFVRHDTSPEIVAQYGKAAAAGSYLAISAACLDGMDPEAVRVIEAVSARSSAPVVMRSAGQIEQLFEGFELLDPGLADIAEWADEEPASIRMLAGVARKG
jgi:hypothetical protein